MEKVDLSVIIVNYNTEKFLENLLASLQKCQLDRFQLEIIVVDNASNYDIKKQIAKIKDKNKIFKIKLILNKENLGYARANNRGIKQAKGRYVLLLNSDTLLGKGTLLEMIRFMDNNKQFGAATCRVELADGRLDPACHRGFPTPWASFIYFSGLESLFLRLSRFKIFSRFSRLCQYHQGWKDLTKIHSVDVISGAFFLIRKKVLDQVGWLDERFFMYAEDIDLCLRLKEKGQQIAFNPETKIIHYKKSSGRQKGKGKKLTQKEIKIRQKAKKNFYQTMRLFYEKHYRDKYPWLIRKMVLRGIWIVSKICE